MNKSQADQYNMLLTVENHFNINTTIWGSHVLISDAKTALSAKIDQINTASGQQKDKSTGATMDKAAVRKDLEDKALFVSKAICAYISLNPGQRELHQTVYVSKTALIKFRGPDLLYYVECLDEAAVSVLENLAPYGVTEVTITDLMQARTAFYDNMKTPAAIIANRKDAAQAVADLLHQAIAILNDTMDNLIGVLKASEPHFVNVYFIERKIHRIGKHTRSLEITTVNAADRTPLEGVQIQVVDHNIKRRSSKIGLNRVQNLKEGYYTLSVSRPDFVSQVIPFTIISGQTTQLVIEMAEEVSKLQRFKSPEPLENFGPLNL